MGLERVLELLKEQGAAVPPPAPDAYAIVPDAGALPQAMQALRAVRAAGVSVQMHAASAEGMGSMKSQFKKADGSGARYALVFGTDELATGEVTVKALRDGQGAQQRRPLATIADWAGSLLS
jgi:histidyl-tRNA synthetase